MDSFKYFSCRKTQSFVMRYVAYMYKYLRSSRCFLCEGLCECETTETIYLKETVSLSRPFLVISSLDCLKIQDI